MFKDCANESKRRVRRDVSKLKPPFVPYIISGLSKRIIIVERTLCGSTGRSALGPSQVAGSGNGMRSQHWGESVWPRVFALGCPEQPWATA